MADKKKDFFDSLFDDLDISDASNGLEQRKGVTLWLPLEYQLKWIEIQHKTKKKFGKKIRDFVIQAIDKVDR